MNWRDSSRIVTLFSRDNGRLDVIAKGANRSGSQYIGILEPLNLVEAIIYFSDKRELQILGKTDLESSFSGIKNDLGKMGYALGILEILNTFFKDHNPAADFYNFVIHILHELEKDCTAKVIFWYFMLKLTSYLGFKPEFENCRICNKEISGKTVNFSFESGSVICAECASIDEYGFRLQAAICNYLADLQSTNYKKISTIAAPKINDTEVTGFLQAYLRYHTNEKLELNALNYYKLG